MQIIKTTKYKKDLQKKIINKHKKKEEEIILRIEELIILSDNMKELLINSQAIVYGISKKKRRFKRNIYSKNQSEIEIVHKTYWRISI